MSASRSLRGLGGAGHRVIPAVGEEAAGRVWGRTLCRKAWNRNLSNAWYFPGLPLPLGLWGPPHIPFPEETGGSQLPRPTRSFQAVALALRPYCVHTTQALPYLSSLSAEAAFFESARLKDGKWTLQILVSKVSVGLDMPLPSPTAPRPFQGPTRQTSGSAMTGLNIRPGLVVR